MGIIPKMIMNAKSKGKGKNLMRFSLAKIIKKNNNQRLLLPAMTQSLVLNTP